MTDQNNDEKPIPIAVPAIIELERFQRVAVRRHSRAPGQTPPLHVTPRSSLTGLCRCGYCGSPMHIATGKGGRYRYLKCNRRNSVSNNACTSPNVPFERFEALVIQTISESVLTDVRLQLILDDAKRNIEQFAHSHSEEAISVERKQGEVRRKLGHLLKLVEDGKTQIDGMLGERIKTWQDELDVLTARRNSLKVPVILPPNLLEGLDFAAFRTDILALLSDTSTEQAKMFLHLVVKEIRIYAEEATVSGPNLGVLEAAIAKTKGTAPAVPSFMYNWRRRRDSNPRYEF